jgi:hypothetical protein
MGNRRHNKKLRAEVRAAMASTGESYQKVLARVLAERAATPPPVDLVAVTYFGAPAILAAYLLAGRLACLVVSSGHHLGPFPRNPLVALAARGPRLVH